MENGQGLTHGHVSLLLDDLVDLIDTLLTESLCFGFYHNTDERLRTAGTQQNASVFSQLRFDSLRGRQDIRILHDDFFVGYRHILEYLRIDFQRSDKTAQRGLTFQLYV